MQSSHGLLPLVLLVAPGQAKERISQEQVISYVKSLNASRIDSDLPKEPFEQWLKGMLGDKAEVKWEWNDCGEGGDRDPKGVPMCVEARARVEKCVEVYLDIAVGNFDEGILGEPVLFMGGIEPFHKEISKLSGLSARLKQAREEAQNKVLFLQVKSLKPLSESEAVEYVKNLDASRLDKNLPKKPFGDWLSGIVGPDAKTVWRLQGCGGRGVPTPMAVECGEEIPACVGLNSSKGSWRNREFEVVIAVKVGSYQQGILGSPSVEGIGLVKKKIFAKIETLHELAKHVE